MSKQQAAQTAAAATQAYINALNNNGGPVPATPAVTAAGERAVAAVTAAERAGATSTDINRARR